MHTDIIGHPMDIGSVFQHQSGQFIQGSLFVPSCTELIDLLGGQAEHLAQLPNGGPVLKGVVGAQKGDMLEAFKNIGRWFCEPEDCEDLWLSVDKLFIAAKRSRRSPGDS